MKTPDRQAKRARSEIPLKNDHSDERRSGRAPAPAARDESLGRRSTRRPSLLYLIEVGASARESEAFTSVCTEEAHLFAEAMPDFERAGASVIGVSSDTIETQRKFSSMECRDKFPVAADPDLKVIKAYDVGFGMVGAILPFADRVSFVIAPDGRILSRVKSSSAAPHVEQSLAAVKAWKEKAGG